MASKATEEQVLYAKVLNYGMLIGLIGIVITYAIYGLGIMQPQVPMDDLQTYWKGPVKDYLAQSGVHAGWGWLRNIKYGDMLNFVPIAFLSGLTMVCYLAILPGLLRKKDTAYAIIAVLEIVVLGLAASGIFGSGGH